MNSRLVKLILFWNAVLTALLLGSLLVNANFAMAANDPPVKVFTAHAQHAGGLDGGGTTTNVSINSDTSWTQLLTVDLGFGTQTHNHQCVAIASADIFNPLSGPTHNNYLFDVTLDLPGGGSTDSPGTRSADLINNSSTSTVESVTTNRAFFNIGNGAHTVYFLGRKTTGSANGTVGDSSMSVICMKVVQ